MLQRARISFTRPTFHVILGPGIPSLKKIAASRHARVRDKLQEI